MFCDNVCPLRAYVCVHIDTQNRTMLRNNTSKRSKRAKIAPSWEHPLNKTYSTDNQQNSHKPQTTI